MAQRMARKANQDAFVEKGFDAIEWFEAHRQKVLIGAASVVCLFALVGGYTAWRSWRERTSSRLLAEGMTAYREGLSAQGSGGAASWQRALPLFQEAAGGSPSGQVARYWEGATRLRLGEAKAAAEILDGLADSGAEAGLADSARSLAAEAWIEAGDLDRAAAHLRTLSERSGGIQPQDVCLLRLGDVLMRQGKRDEAVQVWRDLTARFPQGSAARSAQDRLTEQAAGPVAPPAQ